MNTMRINTTYKSVTVEKAVNGYIIYPEKGDFSQGPTTETPHVASNADDLKNVLVRLLDPLNPLLQPGQVVRVS